MDDPVRFWCSASTKTSGIFHQATIEQLAVIMATMTTVSNGDPVSVSDDGKYLAHNLIQKFSVSMALNAILKLGIPDILATSEGNRPLSAAEILAQLPTKTTPGLDSIRNLRRLLNPLVREGAFSVSLNDNKEPVYGLTEVSKWFLKSSEINANSLADLAFDPPSLAAWHHLHELILDETTTPFFKAHGLSRYEFVGKDPVLAAHFQAAMISYNRFQGKVLSSIQQSGVVDGVTTLVDVGGSKGSMVGEIVAHYPNIQGINFDLPYVIAASPSVKGVQHVAGSFFENIPSGDAMFLKHILHNHGDQEAIQILQNCFKALPTNGRVILAEYIKNEQDRSSFGNFVEDLDMMMLVFFKGARERTEEEYGEILKAAGFPRSNVIHNPGAVDLIVGFKD